VVQGLAATVIALSGRYEQILNYVVSIDFISFGLTAASLFVFRRRPPSESSAANYCVPGHPYTTGLFVLACAGIVGSTIWSYPTNSVFGFVILLAGIPVYLYWSRKSRAHPTKS
jgi:basic amino acid/polyamine antiporter, APA family